MTSPAGCRFPRDYAACGLRICTLYLLASRDRSGIEIETVQPVVAAMAQQAPVARVVRPERAFRLDALTDRIEAHLRKIGGSA